MEYKEFLTIKEFAELAGVTRQSVYKKLDNTLSTYVSTIDNQKMLQSKALIEVYHISVNDIDKGLQSTVDNYYQPCQPELTTLKEQFESAVELLKSQLEVKDSQLGEKDRQIEQLQKNINDLTAALGNTTRALSAAQSLHAGTIQQQLEHDHSMDIDLSETAVEETEKEVSAAEQQQPSKATFRQRIKYLFKGK